MHFPYSRRVLLLCALAASLVPVIQSRHASAAPAPSPVQVSPNPVDFGSVDVGSSSTLSVTVNNTGNTAAPVTIDFGKLKPPFQASGDVPPSSIPAHGSFTFSVTFTPTRPGTAKGTITITVPGPPKSKLKVPVQGKSKSSPPSIIVVQPVTVDFGDVPVNQEAATKTFTVSNLSSTSASFRTAGEGGGIGPGFYCQEAPGGVGDFDLEGHTGMTFHVGFSSQTKGTFTKVIDVISGPPGQERIQKVTLKAKVV